MTRIDASPAERATSAEKAAEARIENLTTIETITHDDLDHLREWLAREAPDSVELVTGRALARATEVNSRLSFAEAGQFALQYHEATGGDDVLIGFLDGAAGYFNKPAARIIAAKITDEERRKELLQRL